MIRVDVCWRSTRPRTAGCLALSGVNWSVGLDSVVGEMNLVATVRQPEWLVLWGLILGWVVIETTGREDSSHAVRF
jgi:hypothetical protein